MRGGGGYKTSYDLNDYDILGNYKDKITEMVIKDPQSGMFPKYNKALVIKASDVDANDKKLFGDVKPYGYGKDAYYVVRDNGDWEGKDGQVIIRSVIARKNMDQTSLSEAKRGALQMRQIGQGGSGNYKIKGKSYTEKQLIDMGYTLDQIKPYKQ